MNVIASQIDWNNPETVEKILAEDGFAEIDTEFGYLDLDETSQLTDSLDDLEDYISEKENLLGGRIEINKTEQSVSFYKGKVLLGEIKMSTFSLGNIFLHEHLYKSIDISQRRKGVAETLLDVYIKIGFTVPNTEYSRDIGIIGLLLKSQVFDLTSIMGQTGNERDIGPEDLKEQLSKDEVFVLKRK